MKLRNGWKAHGGYWTYRENALGFSVESVVQFTENGVKKYEAHYRQNGCCGFAETLADLWGTKKFDSRNDAFEFCEQMYSKRIQK